MATYDLTASIPVASTPVKGDILNCPYSGFIKSIQLPAGQYKLECWGAQGGNGSATQSSHINGAGGNGGYTKGQLPLSSETTLYVVTGGQEDLSFQEVDCKLLAEDIREAKQ